MIDLKKGEIIEELREEMVQLTVLHAWLDIRRMKEGDIPGSAALPMLTMAEKGHVKKLLMAPDLESFREVASHAIEVARRRFRSMAEKGSMEGTLKKLETHNKRLQTRVKNLTEQAANAALDVGRLQEELKRAKGDESEEEWLEAGRQEGHSAGLEAGKLKKEKELRPVIEELEKKVENQRQQLRRLQDKSHLRLVG